MSEMARFQQQFGGLLADPSPVADAATRRALTVHRNTARKAARDALVANYPVVVAMVGEAAFLACASAFVEERPPVEPRLCLYGAGFAGFVAAWAPFAEAPYLGAVAAVERLVTGALFAADAPPLDPTAGLDADAPLALHPATRIETFDCPVASLWLAHQDDAAPDALDTIDWAHEAVLVTRPGSSVAVTAIDRATHAFLTAPTLGDAASAAADAGGDVAAIFAALITTGAFAAQP